MCVVSRRFFDKLDPTRVVWLGETQDGNGATGDVMRMAGRCLLKCQVGDIECQHEFYVAENFCGDAVIGIDMIHELRLMYDPSERAIFFMDNGRVVDPTCTVAREVTIPPRSVQLVTLQVGKGMHRLQEAKCLSLELRPRNQNMTPDELLVSTDSHGRCEVYMINRGVVPVTLARGEIVGTANEEKEEEVIPLKRLLAPLEVAQRPPATKATRDNLQYIRENLSLEHLPVEVRAQYASLVEEFHDIVSYGEHDFGETDVLQHEIPLHDPTPCYQKQFPIPESHRQEVVRQVTEWLRLGVIERCHSEFNSAVFAVPKKLANGEKGLRIVLDYRQVNAKSIPANYRLPLIQESLDELGRSKPEVFSQLDLRSGFHNVYVKAEDRPKTAFHVPNMGQFQWVRAPFGLRNMPLTFQRLMDIVFADMVPAKLLLYIDDLLCKASTHQEMLSTLRECFVRLRRAGLKLNLQKCALGVKECVYLGFKLTPDGYAPNEAKVAAIRDADPPETLKHVRTFLGMTNFFRNSIRDYARIAQHLSGLTCRDSGWTRGPLPQKALKAYKELKKRLCEAPILAYPKPGLPYHLYVDASLGTVEESGERGGLGAVLCQDQDGIRRVIAYASRGLVKHERNYTAFLLELQAILWATEHFRTYLTDVQFVVHTDHKPLTNLSKVHTRTLNRLQQLLLDYDFTLEYCEGEKNPSDYLSRSTNVMAMTKDKMVSGWLSPDNLAALQAQDPLCRAIRDNLEGNDVNLPEGLRKLVNRYADKCQMKNGLLFYLEGEKPLVVAPGAIQADILGACHGHILTGHGKAFKTVNRIKQMWWWPGVVAEAEEFVKDCVACQRSKGRLFQSNTFLQPHEQPQVPFERCHVDLFGPLRTSDQGKKYIMVLTDAYSKYARFVAIPNKEPETVAQAIFTEWICRYGCMAVLVSDRGVEFISKLNQELYKWLKIDKRATSPLHPQCNSAAEVLNKSIIAYLRSMLDNQVLDWETLLAPMELAYNTGTSKATRTSPFFMLYGVEPRTPMMDPTLMNRVMYGESYAQDVVKRLQLVRKIAAEHNIEYKRMYTEQHAKNVKKVEFRRGNLVWLYRPDLPTVNVKLTCCWEGPYVVVEVTESNVLITHVKTGKTRFVHQDRVKLFRGKEEDGMNSAEVVNEDLDLEAVGTEREEEPAGMPAGIQEPSSFCMPELSLSDDVQCLEPEKPMPLPIKLAKEEPESSLTIKAEPVSPVAQEVSQARSAEDDRPPRELRPTPGSTFVRNIRNTPIPTPVDLAAALFSRTRGGRREAGLQPLEEDVLSVYPPQRRPSAKRSRIDDNGSPS